MKKLLISLCLVSGLSGCAGYVVVDSQPYPVIVTPTRYVPYHYYYDSPRWYYWKPSRRSIR